MTRTPSRFVAMLPLLLAAGGAVAADITVYRCTDAKGNLTLRDTPCRKGETQQTKEMQRPKDPPPSRRKATAPAVATAPAAEPPPTHYIVMTPPRPMYDCVTPDGNRYLSETQAGNPRWVPLWTLGYPVVIRGESRYDTGLHARVGGQFDGGDGRYDVRIGERPPPRPPNDGPSSGYAAAYGAGTWIYDECHPLPQEEVCARLRDQRWTLDRRYNSALQSERRQIEDEQRGIDARLSSDCGGA